MDLSGIGIFALSERRLAWLDQRQQVLAQNIANADTPGWQPRDVAPFAQMLASAAKPGLARTQSAHLVGTQSAASASEQQKRPSGRAPDGNAVSIEEQVMKVAENETAQELVTNLYTKYIGLFRLALGRSQQG